MEVTINYLLAMEKSLKERLKQLDELKTQSARRTRYELLVEGDKRKVEEPTYDIRAVDRKITAINKALFTINHTVKTSNAVTRVNVDIVYDDLVSELV